MTTRAACEGIGGVHLGLDGRKLLACRIFERASQRRSPRPADRARSTRALPDEPLLGVDIARAAGELTKIAPDARTILAGEDEDPGGRAGSARRPLARRTAVTSIQSNSGNAAKNCRCGRPLAAALALSMCSERNRTRRAVGSCERLASCGRAPRSACRTWPTTFAAFDAGTARRGMKTVELSAVFSGRKKKPGRQSKIGPNPNLYPRTLFEVP